MAHISAHIPTTKQTPAGKQRGEEEAALSAGIGPKDVRAFGLRSRRGGARWEVCVWMANLGQELQDGGGEQRADGESHEIGEHVLHEARLHQRHDQDAGEGEGADHRHAHNRETPHWRGGRTVKSRAVTCTLERVCESRVSAKCCQKNKDEELLTPKSMFKKKNIHNNRNVIFNI